MIGTVKRNIRFRTKRKFLIQVDEQIDSRPFLETRGMFQSFHLFSNQFREIGFIPFFSYDREGEFMIIRWVGLFTSIFVLGTGIAPCADLANEESLTTGLTAYFPLDGDFKDQTGNGNDLELIIGEFTYTEGVRGQALVLNGSSYGEGALKKLPLGKSERTLCVWVKSEDANGEFDGNQSPNFLFGWGNFKSGGDSFGIMEDGGPWLITDDWFTYTRENERMDGHDVSFTRPVVHEWQFLCAMYRGGTIINCVAGEEVKTASVPIDTQGTHFYLGTSPMKGRFNFKGSVDEIRVYDRALTPEEIQRLYRMGKKEN